MSELQPSDPLVGKTLPQATLEATEVGKVRIPDDLKGAWTLLYFYPKDDTPGCTRQAQDYRDHLDEFRKMGVRILGVSGDDLESHRRFKEKYQLNFPLLADKDHILGAALGTWHVTVNQGKSFWGNSRDTFLIDPDGKVTRVWRKVSSSSTGQETLDECRRLIGEIQEGRLEGSHEERKTG